MSNYTKSTNFATKDALASGNPLKIVKGAEIDTEFNNIATAVATKADLNSPTLVTPALGTPSSGTLTNCTSLPINGGTTGTLPVSRGGTGVTTSTGSGNAVLSTSPTLVTPVLGTPSSGNLANCTSLPIDGGTTGTLSVARGGTGVTTSTGSGSTVLSASPALSGTPTAPTATSGTNTTQIATTAFVTSSPAFSGTPTAPTAAAGTNTTQIATTAHVFAERTNTATLTNKTLTSPSISNPTINAGSASAPSITTTGDADTGIYFPGANRLGIATNGVQRAEWDASGNFQFNSGYGSVATVYGCRAWVNFDGTGTVAIRSSGNVSSITDNGTGDYTVNFTTAMPDANYALSGAGEGNSGFASDNIGMISKRGGIAFTTSAARILCGEAGTGSAVPRDMSVVSVQIFR